MEQKIISLEEALGQPLSHDLTQVLPEKGYKGARFRKGHIITQKDLPILRSMGREHLSVLYLEKDEVHENDAALRLGKTLQGAHLSLSDPEEGKCVLSATVSGLLRYDPDMVHAINEDPLWIFATLPPQSTVAPGDNVGGLRILPLAVKEETVRRAEECAKPLEICPFRPLRISLVTTGSELKKGLVSDAFAPKLRRKLKPFGGTLLDQQIVGDAQEEIAGALRKALEGDPDVVLCTGGMSVDADDRTPGAIQEVADTVLFRGVPALPGSMLMLGMHGTTALIGAPACVVHDERTTLDPLLTQIAAGIYPTEKEVRRWGVGGLCAGCSPCTYPRCSFGIR
jgi:hypothetical protein